MSAEIKKQKCGRAKQVLQPAPFYTSYKEVKGYVKVWIATLRRRVPGLLSGYRKSAEGFRMCILRT